MDLFPLASLLAGAFITLLCFVLFLNIFGLHIFQTGNIDIIPQKLCVENRIP